MIHHIFRLTLAAVAAMLAMPASAHVSLEQQAAPVGSTYKVVLRVPHGCGESPTVRLRVRLPEGIISVKPMVKAGWKIDVAKGAYAKPYAFLHGATFSEGIKEVTWSGGRLPNELYDEFVLSVFITSDLQSGQTLYFPVVQDCEKGTNNWVEIPGADGKPVNDPAPALMLLPKK